MIDEAEQQAFEEALVEALQTAGVPNAEELPDFRILLPDEVSFVDPMTDAMWRLWKAARAYERGLG